MKQYSETLTWHQTAPVSFRSVSQNLKLVAILMLKVIVEELFFSSSSLCTKFRRLCAGCIKELQRDLPINNRWLGGIEVLCRIDEPSTRSAVKKKPCL